MCCLFLGLYALLFSRFGMLVFMIKILFRKNLKTLFLKCSSLQDVCVLSVKQM